MMFMLLLGIPLLAIATVVSYSCCVEIYGDTINPEKVTAEIRGDKLAHFMGLPDKQGHKDQKEGCRYSGNFYTSAKMKCDVKDFSCSCAKCHYGAHGKSFLLNCKPSETST